MFRRNRTDRDANEGREVETRSRQSSHPARSALSSGGVKTGQPVSKGLEVLREHEREKNLRGRAPQSTPGEEPHDRKKLYFEEELTNLFRSINSLLPEQGHAAIQFIGSRQGEGTSTVVSDYAYLLASRFGRSVVVLDADTLQPVQHLHFGVSPTPGWGDVLRGAAPLRKALHRIGNLQLYVCPSSPQREEESPITHASAKRLLVLATLCKRFDLVVIDSPPATLSPNEGLALCDKVNGVVLVVEAEATRWAVADAAKEKIVRAGGKLLGVVLNKRRYHIPELIYKHL